MRKILYVLSICLVITGLLLIGDYMVMTLKTGVTERRGEQIFDEFKTRSVTGLEDSSYDVPVTEDLSVYADLVDTLNSYFDNKDIVGYIYYPEAGIEYPIVQGRTNEMYLRRDVYGMNSNAGSIILDTENNADFSDVASIIYGHHMKNGTMFGKLEGYITVNNTGDEFYVYTRTERITYKTIAYGVVGSDDRASLLVTGNQDYPEFLQRVSSNINDEYKRFVTLITCTYLSQGRKERFGVICAEVNREPY